MTKAAKKLILLMLAALCLMPGCDARTAAKQPIEEAPIYDAIAPGEELRERPAADKLFSINYDPVAGMNPVRANSSANMLFWSLMYDSVFTVDDNFRVSSEVVTDYSSEDYIWWVFNIDSTIPFTDGTTLTAADIVYSIQRAQQTSYYRERLSIIYGISALSEDCFAITTKYANSQFPALLNIPIIKKDGYFEDVPAGTGPYRLAESGDRLVLFTENRHADEMPVDTIYLKDCMDTSNKIRAFEDATIDLVTNDPTGMYNLGYGSSNETRYYETSNMDYIGFNMSSMYFQSLRARCAVNYVIDRDHIVAELMSGCGVPAALPVHPESILYDSEYAESFVYDPAKCAALFESAGVSDYDADGELEMLVTGIVVELKIRFIVNNDSTSKVLTARRIAEELNALGITTVLYEMTWADYIAALEKGEYDMYLGELRISPDWNLSALFQPYEGDREDDAVFQGLNYANNKDPRYSQLYGEYLAASDDLTRNAKFRELCRYIGDTGIIMPVCFERREVLTHRGVVTGIRATQYDVFHNFKDWTIDLS